MARYIARCLLFVLPLLAVLALTEMELAHRPNSYNAKKAALEAHLADTRIVITGSSHALFGVNPEFLSDPAFNMAGVSQDFYYDRALLAKYLPRMPRVQLAILTVSLFSFKYILSDNTEKWRTGFYEKVYGIPDSRSSGARLRCPQTWMGLYGLRETLGRAMDGSVVAESIPDQRGWMAYETPQSEAESLKSINAEAGSRRVKFHLSMMHPGAVKTNMERLESLCRELQSRHVAIALVVPPVFSTYYNATPPTEEEAMRQEMEQIARRFHINIYNYMRDPRFQLRDFHDNDHLARSGSRKFTQILDREVVSQYVLNR